MRKLGNLIFCALAGTVLSACDKVSACADVFFEGLPYTLCEAGTGTDIKLFLKDNAGAIYGDFETLRAELKTADRKLLFAVNGGMYHTNREPVGLYIENGTELARLNVNKGPGNFHLLPNGVFWIGKNRAGVTAADKFDGLGVEYATQSGPMLVIDNNLHPAFRKESTSLRIRNGVGQTADGTIYFAKSELPVNFHSFARFFRDELQTPNALFLDGTVSKLYSPELGRNDTGHDMGPIIGVLEGVP